MVSISAGVVLVVPVASDAVGHKVGLVVVVVMVGVGVSTDAMGVVSV